MEFENGTLTTIYPVEATILAATCASVFSVVGVVECASCLRLKLRKAPLGAMLRLPDSEKEYLQVETCIYVYDLRSKHQLAIYVFEKLVSHLPCGRDFALSDLLLLRRTENQLRSTRFSSPEGVVKAMKNVVPRSQRDHGRV
ncbi:hypothetical protein EVAR_102098_1 [Eumeta japonica]|uniref:Uncharacterized protein n=1 Tax=Eumeta variegata TaxID=151549 RepID=A0A4C1TZY6_EUMVA|nr:hypothetical protein EVAR_102098_1 [Eumeta japonica]